MSNKMPCDECDGTVGCSCRSLGVLRAGSNGKKRCNIIQFSTSAVFNDLPKANKQILNKYHLTYKFIRTECKLVRKILHTFGFSETNPGSSYFNLMWSGCHVKAFDYKSLEPHQKTNHFPRSFELTRKDRLYKNIQTMQQTKGVKSFGFIPKNFILPSEFDAFQAEFAKDRGFWIVKPVASSRGRGIYVINDIKQVPRNDQLLVCKYIDSPLLIDGFKFDCRIYVAVTSFDPLTIYIFEEGLTRPDCGPNVDKKFERKSSKLSRIPEGFSTVPYNNSPENIKNLCMHLTNYSINKTNKDYVRCDHPGVEDYGNKWSFSALLIYLRKIGKDTEALLADIEDVIIKTLLSAEASIASACNIFVAARGNCFELFGFDILIDSNMKPWLLEVNLSPSLACDSPMDLKIKANLMVDLFNLTGFVLRDPIDKRPSRSNGVSRSLRRHTRSSSAGPLITRNVTVSSTGEYSAEEKQMLRDTKEEYRNRGRFVRVYPSPESWRKYGHVHVHCSTKNKALHVMLFPELWQSTPSKALPLDSNRSAHINRYYADMLSSPISNRASLMLSCKLIMIVEHSRNGLTFAQRFKCYERKLLAVPDNAHHRLHDELSFPSTASYSLRTNDLPHTKGKDDKDVNNNTNIAFHTPETRQPVAPINVKSSPSSEQCCRHVAAHVNSLTPYQARMTFSTYLQRVQHRLLQQLPSSRVEETEDTSKHTQQIELVQHFLNKAAENLDGELFENTVLHDNLPLHERRRFLARQLRQFLMCYIKQTEDQYKSKLNSGVNHISKYQFQVFIASASESELESVLTSFTRNKNASNVFFGCAINKGTATKPSNSDNKSDSQRLARSSSSTTTQQRRDHNINQRALSASRVHRLQRNTIRRSSFDPILPLRPSEMIPPPRCYFAEDTGVSSDCPQIPYDPLRIFPRPPMKPKPSSAIASTKRHFYKQCVSP